MRIIVEVNGVELLNQRLATIAGAADAFKEFAGDIVSDFKAEQSAWFDAQGRGSWVPLSPSYAAWKAKYAPGAPLLVLTGDLRSAEFQSQLVSNDELKLTIDAPFYWKFHQFGTVKMPARPPYIIDQETQEKLGKSLAEAIVKKMGF